MLPVRVPTRHPLRVVDVYPCHPYHSFLHPLTDKINQLVFKSKPQIEKKMSRLAGVRTVPSRSTVKTGSRGSGKGRRHLVHKRPAQKGPRQTPGKKSRSRSLSLSPDQRNALSEMAYVRAWQRYFTLGQESLTYQQQGDQLKQLF